MKRSLYVLALMLIISNPLSAQSDTEAGASAVFEQFLVAMTNTDIETVLSLFSEDALFWGTGSSSLVTVPAGVRQYFEPVGLNEPGQTIARARDYSAKVISDELVLISGMWEVVQQGQDSGTPLRVSMAVALRNGEWVIIQFHNSAVPQ
ncbi:MAG: nuclear transport factor 2 family protein [Gammaproteobacteria bacterium]|nr:nuclear transport factor 2 family protein [Gammaproteobacteria bacterium]